MRPGGSLDSGPIAESGRGPENISLVREPEPVIPLSIPLERAASGRSRKRRWTMWYRTNVGGKERWSRLAAGAVVILCGLLGLKATLLGLLLAGAGTVTALTGLVGYCPACSVAGRKPLVKP